MQSGNPYATGAGGSDFERRVATAFVCAALVETPVAPFDDSPTKVWLQASHLNCGFDDIVLEYEKPNQQTKRIFISVKSTINPRTSDPEFVDIISKAWKDWTSKSSFDRASDIFLLVAATSRSPRIHLLGKLSEITRATGDQRDLEGRLSIEGYIHSAVRELHPDILAIIEKQTQLPPAGDDVRSFLQHLFVTTFDFDQDASQDKSRMIGVLRLASESRDAIGANACWNEIFECVSLATGKARVFGAQEFQSISSKYQLRRDNSARTDEWLHRLRAHCRITRNEVTANLAVTGKHVSRAELMSQALKALSSSQFVLVTGPPGTGKSALAVEAAESFAKPENVFCFQSEEFAFPHLDNVLQSAGLRGLNPEEWSNALPFEPRVIVIEALERMLQSTKSCEALTQLFGLITRDGKWRVIVTCRDYLADHVRDAWAVIPTWNLLRVPLLEPEEFQNAIVSSGIPELWLQQPAVRDVLRNLKWLDLTIRAAQRIVDPTTVSNWSTVANWRDFVWRRVLTPEIDVSAQELLIRIAIERATSGRPWITLDTNSLKAAENLENHGVLNKHDAFADRFKPEHDLWEDWALLFHVRRRFIDHEANPKRLFSELGNHLLMRRAFRQFFGELLDSDKQAEGVAFIRRVFAEPSCGKEWRDEVLNALLGASSALDVLRQTRELWIERSGERLRRLCHVAHISYRRKPEGDAPPERPFGPGWNAIITFFEDLGEEFLRENVPLVTELLLDWRHIITQESPTPEGLSSASSLVLRLWKIATEGDERFEEYWGEDWRSDSPSANRLCWLVASVAGALDSQFFHDAARKVFSADRTKVPSAYSEKQRQCEDLVQFLVSSQAGWVLARFHPRTMVRLCLQAYGLHPRRRTARHDALLQKRDCGITDGTFSPSSALRGPFLELLRSHRQLGEQLVLHLVNESTRRWKASTDPDDAFNDSFEVTLNINGREIGQVADQGWWRCYRGWSPYPEIIECALMALEAWLLDDIAARNVGELESSLLHLIERSNNVAITAVAASVGGLHWSQCGHLAAALLECWPLLALDRHRWMNDRTPLGNRENDIYSKERNKSNALPHRTEHLEQFILMAQFGPARSDIWAVLDQFNSELKAIPVEQTTDDIQTARLIIHRIDSRNLRVAKDKENPDRVLLHAAAHPPELRKYLEESGKKLGASWNPMEMQMWASQILEPIGVGKSEPQRWREMLEKARNFNPAQVETEWSLLFRNASPSVAAVCLCNFMSELSEEEIQWCVTQVTEALLQQADLTVWQPGSVLTNWQAECGAARACGILSATRPPKLNSMRAIDEATSIALTHPERRVRFAAAEGIGGADLDSSIQFSACELLISHARQCREIDLRHRGPQAALYEHIRTWQDRCAEMHRELTNETRRLRNRFVEHKAPNLNRLKFYYPRGEEEEQNLAAILAVLLNQSSPTAVALFRRVRNWLAIQFIDENDHHANTRRFAADAWRDHYRSRSRANPVNTGEVSRVFSRRTLKMTPNEMRAFLAPILAPRRIAHLRGKAGEFLKDLSIVLDEEGNPVSFWTAWDLHFKAAVALGSQINDEDHWRKQKVSPKAVPKSFEALLAAIFLNGMYMRADQEWAPLTGQHDRFKDAFSTFHIFALNYYIAFLNTVGGGLLPGAWIEIADCVRTYHERFEKTFLSGNSHRYLLRLLNKEISSRRVSAEDQKTWGAIFYLLSLLSDAGYSEAFRLRESVARITPTSPPNGHSR